MSAGSVTVPRGRRYEEVILANLELRTDLRSPGPCPLFFVEVHFPTANL